jgi:hypothetical protein
MAKTKISEFSANPANNTDIDSINIAEGCAPSGINDAIRELMAQLKDFQVGSAGDPVTVGGVLTVTAGAVGTPAITTDGDTNTGIFFPAADTIAFAEGGTEAMRIDSSGNLGIGSTAALSTAANRTYLSLKGKGTTAGDGSGVLQFQTNAAGSTTPNIGNIEWALPDNSGSSAFRVAFISSSAEGVAANNRGSNLQFATKADGVSGAGTERMRIDSSGNVGIGTSSPGGKLEVNQGKLIIKTSDQSLSRLQIANTGVSGQTFEIVAGDVGTGNTGLSFYDVTNSATRMRIDSSGNLLVGTTSNSTYGSAIFCLPANGEISVVSGALRSRAIYNTTTSNSANQFIDASGYLYRSTSSLKYKTDVQNATHGLAEVMALRPVTYKGKNDGDFVFGGLIAEEVHEAGLTEFVQYAEDGTPDALAYGSMVSLAFKAIQEQQAIITALTARVEALESN